METSKLSSLQILSTLKKKKINLFTLNDFTKLFQIDNVDTLKHTISRLKKQGVIENLARGRFLFLHGAHVSDFAIANFLISESYVSLESALSYFGVLDQFPYRVTSVTIHKSLEIKARGKIFSYARIKKELFNGFEKVDDFLIATRKKALRDYEYFVSKGLKSKI